MLHFVLTTSSAPLGGRHRAPQSSTPSTLGPLSARIPSARCLPVASNSTRQESGEPLPPTLPANGCCGGPATMLADATLCVRTDGRLRRRKAAAWPCCRRRAISRWTPTFSPLPPFRYGTIWAATRTCRPPPAQRSTWPSALILTRTSRWRFCPTDRYLWG